MTQFLRRGHWRTSALGNPYWVSEHDVSRYDWDRTSGSSNFPSTYFSDRLRAINADRGPTSTFVHPNAECPVCGARVFFYQNRFGSRVYFDDLGKPWPKHPCTDNAKYTGSALGDKRQAIEPELRGAQEVSIIQDWLRYSHADPQQDFWNKHGVSQWDAYRIGKRLRSKGSVLLVLDPVGHPDGRRIFLSGRKVPAAAKEGSVVFHFRGWINYFDLDLMEPVEMELQRLKGPTAFIDALLASSK